MIQFSVVRAFKFKKDHATYSYTYRYRRVRKSYHLHNSQCNDITTSFVNCGQAAILSFKDTCITACVLNFGLPIHNHEYPTNINFGDVDNDVKTATILALVLRTASPATSKYVTFFLSLVLLYYVSTSMYMLN